MTTAEPAAYIVNVLGKTRKELVAPVTHDNLEDETDRLSRLVAEVSNCKAVIDDCTPLIADARTKLAAANLNPTLF